MKLSVGFYASLAAADAIVSEPVKSLQLLTGFSADILQSGAFEHKSDKWRNRWVEKFQRNADRMEKNVGRKCGFYDADIHTFNYEYDTENACNGIKMIIDGYSTWVENHLSDCSGQGNFRHQEKRLLKWSGLLADALDCESNISSYTFVIPEEGSFYDYDDNSYEIGHSLEVSDSCNPDFIDASTLNCTTISEQWQCDGYYVDELLYYSTINEYGILETALQCPQCGCGADGALNLYDLLADDSNRKNSMGKKRTQSA